MTSEELEKRLLNERLSVPFAIGAPCEDALCLDEIDGQWCIYVYDHGEIFVEDRFDSEEEACDAFYKEIYKDKKRRENR